MPTVKKLIFAPLFLISFLILLFHLSTLFKSYDFIFSLSLSGIYQLILVAILLKLSCLLFVLFVCFASNWKFILPLIILTALSPLLFFEVTLAIILGVGILVSLVLTATNLDNTLKTYTSFQAAGIFGPPIRHLATFLILIICIAFFIPTNQTVAKKGFQIPDPILDAALKFTPMENTDELETSPSLPTISSDQLELLKQNPDLLRQSGLDPSILDSLDKDTIKTPKNLTAGIIKQTLKDQLDKILKPYLEFIPMVLTVLLFFLLQSFTSLINLLIYPLLWTLFIIFEKTGFIKFSSEMRPVKKMIL